MPVEDKTVVLPEKQESTAFKPCEGQIRRKCTLKKIALNFPELFFLVILFSNETKELAMQFLDPKSDMVFKRLFGDITHKNILMSFLNSVLGRQEGEKIVNVT